MSEDDLRSAGGLLPKFQLVIPSRPHGSIVFGNESVSGVMLMPGEHSVRDSFSVRTFQHGMVTWPPPEGSASERLRFKRLPLAVGVHVRQILAKIAVVG